MATLTVQDSTLRTLVAYAQQVAPELADRLDRAAALVQAGHVRGSYSGLGFWYVRSQTRRDRVYLVTEREHGAWPCACPDFRLRRNWCKHGLAAALTKRLQAGRGPSAPAPTTRVIPFPQPALDPDAPIPFELTAKALAG